MDPDDAREIQYGKKLVGLVNANIATGQPPLHGIDNDDLQKIMSYIVLRRENPILGPSDHINYEGAVLAKVPSTFEDRKKLEEQFVNQVNRVSGLLLKKLSYSGGKIKVLEEK